MPHSKSARMKASIVNKTSTFGIMGGLFNRKIAGRSSMNRVTSRLEIPTGADAGYKYMKLHNLLSKNPLGSGGVGRMFTVRPRGSGLGSHTARGRNLGTLEMTHKHEQQASYQSSGADCLQHGAVCDPNNPPSCCSGTQCKPDSIHGGDLRCL